MVSSKVQVSLTSTSHHRTIFALDVLSGFCCFVFWVFFLRFIYYVYNILPERAPDLISHMVAGN